MSTEGLSQEEIDALLDAAADEAGAMVDRYGGSPSTFAASPQASAAGPSRGRGIRGFDFKKPNSNLSRAFERNVRGISESFAKDASLGFSNLLRSTCEFRFAGLEVTSFGETLAGMDNPSCIALCTSEPLHGKILLELESGLMFTLFTKLLGGPIEAPGHLREFTEIEMGLSRKLLGKLLEILGSATEKVVRLHPKLVQIENNPNYLNAFGDGEAVLNLRCDVTLEEISGRLAIILPVAAFEPVREKFDPREAAQLHRHGDRQAERAKARSIVGESRAELSATFRPRRVRMSELRSLKTGDVLPLDHHISRPLSVSVEGKVLFEATSGQVGRSRAVRIVGRAKEK